MTLAEVGKYLKMSEKAVKQLVQVGKIPAVKIGNQWRLERERINEWLSSQMGEMQTEELEHLEMDHKDAVIKITPLLKDGNVIFNIYGSTKNQILQVLVAAMKKNNKLKKKDAEDLLHAVIDRERLCSTAIGEGVAVPHPRRTILKGSRNPLLILGITKRGIDFESIDGRPTHLFFLLCAHRDDIHLKLMARLSRLLKDRSFKHKLIQSKDFKQLKSIFADKEKNV